MYVRLVLSMHLISAAFILQASLDLYIQLILWLGLMGYYFFSSNKSPCADLLELTWTENQVRLLMKDDTLLLYDRLSILIHNELFQLIQLSRPLKKKRFVLFNDQVTLDELRLLHVKAGMH